MAGLIQWRLFDRVAARFHAGPEGLRELSHTLLRYRLVLRLRLLLRLRALSLLCPGAANRPYERADGRVLAGVLIGDVADDACGRRAANRAATRGSTAGRRCSLLHLNAGHRIRRIDAGVLPRPRVAFAFVLGDLTGGLIVAGIDDEPQRRRHALRDGRVAGQRQPD